MRAVYITTSANVRLVGDASVEQSNIGGALNLIRALSSPS